MRDMNDSYVSLEHGMVRHARDVDICVFIVVYVCVCA